MHFKFRSQGSFGLQVFPGNETINYTIVVNASEPKAVPERANGKSRDGQAEVGNGVQGLPGIGRQLHEHAVGRC